MLIIFIASSSKLLLKCDYRWTYCKNRYFSIHTFVYIFDAHWAAVPFPPILNLSYFLFSCPFSSCLCGFFLQVLRFPPTCLNINVYNCNNNRLWIYNEPDQDRVLTEKKWTVLCECRVKFHARSSRSISAAHSDSFFLLPSPIAQLPLPESAHFIVSEPDSRNRLL